MKVLYTSAVLCVCLRAGGVLCFCWTCRVVLIFVCVSSQTVVGGCPARSQREPCRRPRRRQQCPAHLTPRWPSRSRHSSSHTSRSTGRRNSTPWAELSGGEASLCIARQRLAGQQEQKLHYVTLHTDCTFSCFISVFKKKTQISPTSAQHLHSTTHKYRIHFQWMTSVNVE